MPRLLPLLLLLTTATASAAGTDVPVVLKGSPASMMRQSEIAQQAGYPLVETPGELRERVADGTLVPLTGNADYTLREGMHSGVARPELRVFIERLAAQYHAATGERLVVTSLTRPKSRQPSNAHALSVHPAGIAVDLRISQRKASRQWLESTLLALERQGVLDVTRERWPPHYHVALFPDAYRAHVEQMIGAEALEAALAGVSLEEWQARHDSTAAAEPAAAEPLTSTEASASASVPGTSRWSVLWAIPAAVLAVRLVRRRRQS